jgi:hypothetical protein
MDSLGHFRLTDVVINQNKIRLEFHKPFHDASQIKRNFSDDPSAVDLIQLLQRSGKVNGVISHEQYIQWFGPFF